MGLSWKTVAPEDLARCRELRKQGMAIKTIGRVTGVSAYQLTKLFNPEAHYRKQRIDAERYYGVRVPHARDGEAGRRVIPPEVQAERDRAFGADETVEIALGGGPRPGRSALDKRNALGQS